MNNRLRGRSFTVAALMIAALMIVLASLSRSVHAQADSAPPAILQNVGIEQRLNEQLPLELAFTDEEGRSIRLGEYFGERPVILALVYYECPMLCGLVLDGLVRSLKAVSFDVGKEFDVVAVSFDPGETPQMAAKAKRTYVRRYGRPESVSGWHFLTGGEEAIARLTQSVGFRYNYDSQRDEYAHASAIMVATPRGKLARYFYGIEYASRDVRFGLIEASQNRIGSPVDQMLLFCYHYDPLTGKYGLVIRNSLRIAGIVTVLSLATLVIVLIRREKKI
ncbi:MAG: SCO family protein [Acidobacteriota bacterium]